MTLTRRHLNRATLERQLLLRRAPLSTAEALTHLAGLQAQEAQSWYVGLWSRLAAYDPSETSRLLGEASIVRVGLMRNTIHLVTADDARWLRPLLDPVIERSTMGVFRRGVTGVDRDELVTAARAILAERPMQFAELGRALETHFPGRDPAALGYVARAWLPLAQLPPRGQWGRKGRALHMPLDDWLRNAPALVPDNVRAPERLMLRYLTAFGPATVADCRQWSGLTKLGEVVERMRPQLVTFRDEQGRELFDLPGAPRPDPDTPAPVRFLYDFDNLLLSHDDRSRVVAVDYTAQGFGYDSPEQPRSLLVDGFVAATWKLTGDRLTIRPFRRLTASEREEVEAESAALLAFLAPGRAHDLVIDKPSG
uniref:winged helix DNA-binding domain-containing protein n=1 Tax=Paractinoplanes polyasparticus TaxID=2856853 RepID=UPI001C855EFE|nr:winged helix DNA-binding domain-containing protein [Actinoplanes polyasparticus]